jgi:hypothetical protein
MPPLLRADPSIDLAPWWALREPAGTAEAVGPFLRERLAFPEARPYSGARAGGGSLVVRLPGRSPSLRPMVLLARSDLLDPASLAGLAAAVAVPSLLGHGGLERDVIVVVANDAPPDAAATARPAGRTAAARRPGAHDWFEHQRQHDVKVVVVLGRLRPARATPAGWDLLRVAGIETDARLPAVLAGAAAPACRLVLTRHGDDGLPFRAHGLPYLVVGDAAPAAASDASTPSTTPDGPASAAPPVAAAADLADLERLAGHAARLVANLLIRLDGARLPGPFDGYDSLEHERAAYGAAHGAAYGATGDEPGAPPRDREELERRIAAIWG